MALIHFLEAIMKVVRRLTTTISANFASLVDQIENHEALADAGIREVEQAFAKAKVDLKRVERDGRRMQNKLTELASEVEVWRARAKEIKESDREKALRCVEKMQRAEEQIIPLKAQLTEQRQMEQSLKRDLRKIEDRLHILHQRKNALMARESRAIALKDFGPEESMIFSEIDRLFDRWETRVNEHEIRADINEFEGDDLEQEFAEKDRRKNLELLLDTIEEEKPTNTTEKKKEDKTGQ